MKSQIKKLPEQLKKKALSLQEEISEMYTWLQVSLDKSNPDALMLELEQRGVKLARSAEMMADAQVILDAAKGIAAEKHLGTEESWNIVKSIIESEVATEKKLYSLCERANATLTHQMDEIRTLISFEKASMNALGDRSANTTLNQIVLQLQNLRKEIDSLKTDKVPL